MSMKMVCNRCNKIKEDGEHFNRILYIRSDKHYDDSEYDLCPECSKQFSMFINGGTVEEDRYKDSKPSAVVIHKLANGHYAIENAPNERELDAENDEIPYKAHEQESMNQEKSDLSVKTHKNAAGVTVPDSEPWERSNYEQSSKT